MHGNVNDPATWHRLMLRALAGLQAGDQTAAREYLRFVQQHRGREVSDAAKLRLLQLAQSPAFANAQQLLAQALQPPAPRARPTVPPRRSRRR